MDIPYNTIGLDPRGIHIDGSSDLDSEYNTLYSDTAGNLDSGGIMVTVLAGRQGRQRG